MARKVIDKYRGFKLIQVDEPIKKNKENSKENDYVKYLIHSYIGSNKKVERVLCYKKRKNTTDRPAKDTFRDLIRKHFGSGKDEIDTKTRENFIKTQIAIINKYSNPDYLINIEYEFDGQLGKKLKRYLRHSSKQPFSKGHKERDYIVAKALHESAKIGESKTLTATVVKRYFNKMMSKDSHLAPATIRTYKKTVCAIARFLKINPDKLFEGVDIWNREQLKAMGIKIAAPKRRHHEKSEIRKMIPELLKIGSEENITNEEAKELDVIRSAIFLQLITGCRPNDVFTIQSTPKALLLYAAKTRTNVIVNMSKEIKALFKLANIKNIYNEVPVEGIQNTLNEVSVKATGQKTERYNLRHTVLTMRFNLEGATEAAVMREAGLKSARILHENYSSTARPIKENIPFTEEGEIQFPMLEKTWRGWLVQECLFAKYPSLKEGIAPNCKEYTEIYNVLCEIESKPKKILELAKPSSA